MNIAEFFLGSIPLLLQFYAEMYRETDLQNTMNELETEFNVPKVKNYDFIIGKLILLCSLIISLSFRVRWIRCFSLNIVGGGSAGCVLAGRLSEHFSVLLLEAGGSPPPATYVSYFTADVGKDPSINYFYRSVPQENAARCCDGVCTTYIFMPFYFSTHIIDMNLSESFVWVIKTSIFKDYINPHWPHAWWLRFSQWHGTFKR